MSTALPEAWRGAPPAAPAPRTPLRLRWIAARNALIASPWFQRWARSLPGLRGIARARATAMFDYTAGFAYTQMLLACVRLDLPRHLAAGPTTAAALAPVLRLTPEAATRLLRAAAALGIAEPIRLPGAPQSFVLGQNGAVLHASPWMADMIAHNALAYQDAADPVALLRGQAQPSALAQFWGYARNPDPEAVPPANAGAYSRLMAGSQAIIAAETLAGYDMRRHRCLLDIGGGEGAFLTAAAARAPRLRLMLFDLPAVAARAEAHFARAGLTARATTHGGSFLGGALPRGADIATLVRVLHDHDDADAMRILRAAHAALPPGGTLLIAEPMSGPGAAGRAGDLYFGIYLAAMGSGRVRQPAELAAMLKAAGFTTPRPHRTANPAITQLLSARVGSN